VGARQVGKTTLAKMLSAECKKESIYLDMEKTSDLNKLQDAELYFSQNKNKLIIIDEV